MLCTIGQRIGFAPNGSIDITVNLSPHLISQCIEAELLLPEDECMKRNAIVFEICLQNIAYSGLRSIVKNCLYISEPCTEIQVVRNYTGKYRCEPF